MNIYRVKFTHDSDYASAKGIFGYVLADSDEQVFDWLDGKLRGSLMSYIENTETTKEEIILNKGYLGAEDPFGSYTYGSDTYGWELVTQNVPQSQVDFLVQNGIAEVFDG